MHFVAVVRTPPAVVVPTAISLTSREAQPLAQAERQPKATRPVLALRGIAHLGQAACGRRTICPHVERPLPGVEFCNAGVAEGSFSTKPTDRFAILPF